MKEDILEYIKYLEVEKSGWEKRLDAQVKHFKEYVAAANSYDIAEFVPGKAKEIEFNRKKIAEIEEKIRMLNYFVQKSETQQA